MKDQRDGWPGAPRRHALRALALAPAAIGLRALTGCGTAGSAKTPDGPDTLVPDGGLALTPMCKDGDPETPAQTEGPYFKPSSPERASLLEAGIDGTKLILEGFVVTPGCRPVSRALVDIWQCDARGEYDNTGFRLRGHRFSDADGSYRFETILPGLYPGRTRHIHVKVQAPGGRILTTQLYFPGEAQNAQDGIFDSRLIVTAAASSARFTFVV